MIREYAPVGLIPAAWVMTFLTVIEPGIDTYWIRHMHYFMVIFLTGFTVLSWKKMSNNSVLNIWRNVIALGTVFTFAGALSFSLNDYKTALSSLSLGYWLIAPGAGVYLSSRKMDNYVKEYKAIGASGLLCLTFAAAGVITSSDLVLGAGFLIAALSQTYSIVLAAKMDGNI